ncbi:MAG TPA: ATP-binding protein [Nitrospira sp.]|jgi:two-component system, OmpR family, phosphate regulon sensor histidine kinase PhoR|nr:ATP-binding protein [Nitrospira sp.]
MTLSIRWKVTLATLFALACGFVIAGVLAARSLEEQELAQSGQALEVSTNLIAFDLRPLLTTSSSLPATPQLQIIVRELSRRALARVTLVDSTGQVLADSAVQDRDLAGIENHHTRPEIEQAVASGSGTDIRASHTTGDRTLYRAVRLNEPGTTSSPLYLRLGLPMTALEQELTKLKRNLSLAFGSAFLIAVGLSVWLARGLTKPLSDMAAAARQLAAGNHSVRIQTSSRDEVGLLADTLNHMTNELRSKIEELSEDRAQLLAMLTSMVEGVMVLDYKGRILQVNPALERMFGVTRAEARGRQSSEVFGHPKLNALVSTVLAQRTGQEDEIILTPSGRCLDVEASVAGGEQDNEACAVLVFHDITELRRLENIRKDFVANVSHELRTPLTSIKGYVEALLDGGKDDPETSVRFLDIILKQSDRLNLILEDLLQLSKIESGQVQFKQEPLHIGSVVERTIAMVKPLADKKQHRLSSQIAADLPLISGDQERLVQVLANLVDNAIKYTPEGGLITVAARRIPVAKNTADEQRDGIELTVTDTGIGIPERDRPRVFERFYRVDKARSRELGGTGLGLAIVKHIVEGHGGQVWVEGNVPTGSRFVVRLPA